MKVVLLGSLPKGDQVREDWVDWKTTYIGTLTQAVPGIMILHGDMISDNVGPEIVVGHDLWLIKHSDICVVDASQKLGAGTAQEMVLAKLYKKPVVTVLPKDTYHRRSNITFDGIEMNEWIHPFIVVASDYIANNIDEAAAWLNTYASNPKKLNIKDINVFEAAISRFENKFPDIVSDYTSRLG